MLLFTVNKDNWPIRREYLSHVTIIMQMAVYQPRSPAHQNLSHPSSMVLKFSKYLLAYILALFHIWKLSVNKYLLKIGQKFIILFTAKSSKISGKSFYGKQT